MLTSLSNRRRKASLRSWLRCSRSLETISGFNDNRIYQWSRTETLKRDSDFQVLESERSLGWLGDSYLRFQISSLTLGLLAALLIVYVSHVAFPARAIACVNVWGLASSVNGSEIRDWKIADMFNLNERRKPSVATINNNLREIWNLISTNMEVSIADARINPS